MGEVFAYQGRYGAAVSSLQDAFKGFQESKEQGTMATDILLNYGNALALSGQYDKAGEYLTGALKSARDQKSQPQIAAALSYQGDNSFYHGDMNLAATLYTQALQAAANTGDTQMILRTKVNMAKLAIQQGKYASALTTLRGVGEEADSLGLKYLSIVCLVLRGQAMIGTKDFAGAQKELRSATLRSEKLGLRVLQAQSHYELGRAMELSGNHAGSALEFAEARRAAADVLKEAQMDAVTKRSDLAAIFALKA
jgi:tetratricopeptide (TPR) repeat protein